MVADPQPKHSQMMLCSQTYSSIPTIGLQVEAIQHEGHEDEACADDHDEGHEQHVGQHLQGTHQEQG
jgi:hypothetical protein